MDIAMMSICQLAPARDLRPVRSLLFTPADRPERFEKAAASGADGVILDLEDGVGMDAKSAARAALLARWPICSSTARIIWMVRLNHVTTDAGLQDLLALRQAPEKPAIVLLPKVEAAAELDIALAHLGSLDARLCIVALIESARGLERAADIAAHPSCGALAFGGADMAADLGASLAWEPMLAARGRIVQAARAGGVACWDMPFLSVGDTLALAAEAAAAKTLGFDGKLAIHPGQIATINAHFTPTPAEVTRAETIAAAFSQAKGGACVVAGRMVDMPVYLEAQRVLRAAQHAQETP